MWTWQCSSQLGDGATVSFNVVNSPAFSSSLAFPFFVPGHLIAALICSSTRLPLPIYWYFMKITPLNRVNVCLSNPPPHPTSRRLPSPNVSPKTPRGYLVKTLATYGRLNSAFPRKPREMRGGGKRKAISGFASEPCLARFLSNAACLYNQRRRHAAVLWSRSPAPFIAPHISVRTMLHVGIKCSVKPIFTEEAC